MNAVRAVVASALLAGLAGPAGAEEPELVSCGVGYDAEMPAPRWTKGLGSTFGARGFGEHQLVIAAATLSLGHNLGPLELQGEYALGVARVGTDTGIDVDSGVFHRLGLTARFPLARVGPRGAIAFDLETGLGYQLLDLRRGGDNLRAIPDAILGAVMELRWGTARKMLRNWIGVRAVVTPYREQDLTACLGACPSEGGAATSWGVLATWTLAIGR